MRLIHEPHDLSHCPNCSSPLADPSADKCPTCNALITDPSGLHREGRRPHAYGSSFWGYVVGGPLILVSLVLLVFAAKMGSNGGQLVAVPALVYLATGVAVINASSPTGRMLSLLISVFLYYLLFLLNSACIFCR